MPQSAARKKAFILAREIGLTTEERQDFASMMLPGHKEGIDTWSDVTDEEILRLLDGMSGYIYLRELVELHRVQVVDG
jgi:hypothetical protein